MEHTLFEPFTYRLNQTRGEKRRPLPEQIERHGHDDVFAQQSVAMLCKPARLQINQRLVGDVERIGNFPKKLQTAMPRLSVTVLPAPIDTMNGKMNSMHTVL